MHKYIWISLLMTFWVSILCAQQEKPVEKTQAPVAVIQSETPPLDPKLTGIEREMQAGTLPANPAKITTPIVDPKLQEQGEWPVEPQAAIAKPGVLAVDPKMEQEAQVTTSTLPITKEIRTQQVGYDASVDPNTGQKVEAPASGLTNYREMKGEASQTIPEEQPGIINYRNIQGERTQPPGEKPK